MSRIMGEKRRVVVTGLGMATPLGLSVSDSWDKALRGISGIRSLGYPAAQKSPVQAVGEVSEGDWDQIAKRFPDEAAVHGERRTLFALWAACSALDDSAFDIAKANPGLCGVMLAEPSFNETQPRLSTTCTI